MASLFRPTFTRYLDAAGRRVSKQTPGATPKRERSKTWWANYRGVDGKRNRVSLHDDHDTAESMLADLVKRVRREESGDADPFEASRKRPLAEHIADFEKHLAAKNRTPHHIFKIGSYFRRVADACEWKTLAALSSDDLANYLHERRQPSVVTQVSLKQAAEVVASVADVPSPPLVRLRRLSKRLPKPVVEAQRGFPARWDWSVIRPILAREFGCNLPQECPLSDLGLSFAANNDYIAAARNFGNWLTKSRPKRWPENPFTNLTKLNAAEDVRHERRPASADELARIVQAARKGQPFRGLSGDDRAVLYLVAAYTGLRASELASLTTANLDLHSDPPLIVLKARHSKRRREDEQPIPPDLAGLLAEWLAGKADANTDDDSDVVASVPFAKQTRVGRNSTVKAAPQKLWPGQWRKKGATMLARDLDAAGITYETDAGILDFHALRGTFATMLSKSGVSPKAAQELMRHSDIRLTMQTYTSLQVRDVADSLTKLPPIPWTMTTTLAATGTESAHAETMTTPLAKTSLVSGSRSEMVAGGPSFGCPKAGHAPPEIADSQVLSRTVTTQSDTTELPTNNPHFLRGNEGFCESVSAADSKPPLGLEPRTYALRKRRSAN